MTQTQLTTRVRNMFDSIAVRYDLLNSIISLGMDASWRKKAVAELRLSSQSSVADLACGTGALLQELQQADMRPVGVDISERMLQESVADTTNEDTINDDTINEDTTNNVVMGDCLQLPFRNGFADGLTCAFALRHFVSQQPLLREAARVLRPRGRLVLLELDRPENLLFRAGHKIYSQTFIPLAGRLLSNQNAYQYLPDSLELLPSPESLAQTLSECGFENIRKQPLNLGIAQLVSASKAG